jgi:hypothetical protein
MATWDLAQVYPVGFLVDKEALGQVFLRVLRFSPVNIIPPWAPLFRKLKKIVLSFIHPFTHPHSGTDKRPVKAAAVQRDVSLTPITRTAEYCKIVKHFLIKVF